MREARRHLRRLLADALDGGDQVGAALGIEEVGRPGGAIGQQFLAALGRREGNRIDLNPRALGLIAQRLGGGVGGVVVVVAIGHEDDVALRLLTVLGLVLVVLPGRRDIVIGPAECVGGIGPA